jgi:hypothetical protein
MQLATTVTPTVTLVRIGLDAKLFTVYSGQREYRSASDHSNAV